jgi:hypothetical protein
MIVRCSGWNWSAALFVIGLFAAAPAASAGDDPEAKKRLEVMRAAVTALEGSSKLLKPKELTAAPEPLLRYSDPTRVPSVLLDAGVWRLGTEGRPKALVTVELYRRPNETRVLSYEFLSMTPTEFSLKHKSEKVAWDGTESGLRLKELPDAPKPEATAPKRLTQMRRLVARFAAKEMYNGDTTECRLITTPMDRYQSEAEKIVDGAIFALAIGTNPEIGIVLECDAEKWFYGIIRLSGAQSWVTLDGKEVVAYEKFKPRSRTDGPYANGWQIELGK